MAGTRRFRLGLGVLAIVAAVAVVLGSRQFDDSPHVDPVALDTYQPGNVAFFSRLDLYTSAALTESYDTVDRAAQSASVTVVAEVADVRLSHWVGPPKDRIPMIAVAIEPADVLVGELPDEFSDDLSILFPADERDPDGSIESLRSVLPEGQAVWFLRSGEERVARAERYQEESDQEVPEYAREIQEIERKMYVLISPKGLLVQGEQGVVSPVSGREEDGSDLSGDLPADAATYATLSKLVDRLRAGR